MKRRVAAIVKRLRQRLARVRRWHHRRQGHLVFATPIRDYTLQRGEFQFYWRRGFLCRNCLVEWPVWK